MSSREGIGWGSSIIAVFKSLGSKQILNLPFDFSQITGELVQGVNPSTFEIMPFFSISSRAASSLGCEAIGTLLGAWTTGFTFGSTLISYSKFLNIPTPPKHSGYISFKSALLLMVGLE